MTEAHKKPVSRRALLGGMGKLAYVAPTLTVLSLISANAQAIGSPPCPPDGCTAGAGTPSPKQKSHTKSRTKPRK